MSSFVSGKLSFGPLFSYTFPDRSSFLTSFSCGSLSPGTTFCPSASTISAPVGRTICPESSASIWALIKILRATPWSCPIPHHPPTFHYSLQPRFLVKRFLAQFPTGRKKSYKRGSNCPSHFLPVGRPGLQVSIFNFLITPSPRRHAGKMNKLQTADSSASSKGGEKSPRSKTSVNTTISH